MNINMRSCRYLSAKLFLMLLNYHQDLSVLLEMTYLFVVVVVVVAADLLLFIFIFLTI